MHEEFLASMRAGRAFHAHVRDYFFALALPDCTAELTLIKGRPDQPYDEDGTPLPMTAAQRVVRGRADLLFWIDPATCEDAVVVEAKYTDWDVLAERGRVRLTIARHSRQVRSYTNATVMHPGLPDARVDLRYVSMQSFLAYPWMPADREVREWIERTVIPTQVYWFDEPRMVATEAGRRWSCHPAARRRHRSSLA